MAGAEFFCCTKCRQEFVISEAPQRFYLVENTPPQPIDYDWAWCEKCLKAVHAEKLDDPDELQESAKELGELSPVYKEMLFKSGWGDQDKLDRLPQNVRWLRERKSKARCLECGSTSICYLEGSLSEDGFTHPGCSGLVEVVAVGDAPIPDKAVFYDLEGNRIRSIPNEETSVSAPVEEKRPFTTKIEVLCLLFGFIVVLLAVLYQFWKGKH